jgi:hypothetical protein
LPHIQYAGRQVCRRLAPRLRHAAGACGLVGYGTPPAAACPCSTGIIHCQH